MYTLSTPATRTTQLFSQPRIPTQSFGAQSMSTPGIAMQKTLAADTFTPKFGSQQNGLTAFLKPPVILTDTDNPINATPLSRVVRELKQTRGMFLAPLSVSEKNGALDVKDLGPGFGPLRSNDVTHILIAVGGGSFKEDTTVTRPHPETQSETQYKVTLAELKQVPGFAEIDKVPSNVKADLTQNSLLEGCAIAIVDKQTGKPVSLPERDKIMEVWRNHRFSTQNVLDLDPLKHQFDVANIKRPDVGKKFAKEGIGPLPNIIVGLQPKSNVNVTPVNATGQQVESGARYYRIAVGSLPLDVKPRTLNSSMILAIRNTTTNQTATNEIKLQDVLTLPGLERLETISRNPQYISANPKKNPAFEDCLVVYYDPKSRTLVDDETSKRLDRGGNIRPSRV